MKQDEVLANTLVDINDLEALNRKYEPLTVEQRIHELFKDFELEKFWSPLHLLLIQHFFFIYLVLQPRTGLKSIL